MQIFCVKVGCKNGVLRGVFPIKWGALQAYNIQVGCASGVVKDICMLYRLYFLSGVLEKGCNC